MKDPDWARLRTEMVQKQIRRRGVADARVLEALRQVPRERFVPPRVRGRAYTDHALPIGGGQTISQPFMVAVMTEALELGPTDRVLEIGTGSGYQAAVLAELAAEVYTIERIERLADEARSLLDALGYGDVRVRVGDGTAGWPEMAPFDAILVAAGAPAPPPALLDQLSPDGGRLVAPVGDRELQNLVVVERMGTEFTTKRLMACRFVPLVGEEGWNGD